MRAYIDFWRKYADFKGESTVLEFWLTLLWNSIVQLLLNIIVPIILVAAFDMETEQAYSLFKIVFMLYAVICVVPSLSLIVRRLRDAGFSAANLCWLLIPGIGVIALLMRLCTKSKITVQES